MSAHLIKTIEESCGSNILALFPYGSRVYGTNSSQSDFDYIAIVDEDLKQATNLDISNINANVTIYSPKLFQLKLNEHEISVLECFFLNPDVVIKNEIEFNFVLSLPKLRAAISSKASNSWVKTKKKLTVDKDYAPYVGIKSLFHCFRIIEFGRQIAINGTIIDYGATNNIWTKLCIKSADQWTWPDLESIYKERYNKACTEFRLLAPKE